jgi:hypothetical protein
VSECQFGYTPWPGVDSKVCSSCLGLLFHCWMWLQNLSGYMFSLFTLLPCVRGYWCLLDSRPDHIGLASCDCTGHYCAPRHVWEQCILTPNPQVDRDACSSNHRSSSRRIWTTTRTSTEQERVSLRQKLATDKRKR